MAAFAFHVCQDPEDPARFLCYEIYRDQEAHRQHLEMDSYKWCRATAPDLVVRGSKKVLPQHRQVLTRRPYLSV